MPKAGLPTGFGMRHDSHYVDQIASRSRSIGRTIPIEKIYPNPEQPRSEFGDRSARKACWSRFLLNRQATAGS